MVIYMQSPDSRPAILRSWPESGCLWDSHSCKLIVVLKTAVKVEGRYFRVVLTCRIMQTQLLAFVGNASFHMLGCPFSAPAFASTVLRFSTFQAMLSMSGRATARTSICDSRACDSRACGVRISRVRQEHEIAKMRNSKQPTP